MRDIFLEYTFGLDMLKSSMIAEITITPSVSCNRMCIPLLIINIILCRLSFKQRTNNKSTNKTI